MKPRDAALLLLAALIGAAVATLVEKGVSTTGPAADPSDEVAALEKQVDELRARLAERGPASLAASPSRAPHARTDASAPAAPAMDDGTLAPNDLLKSKWLQRSLPGAAPGEGRVGPNGTTGAEAPLLRGLTTAGQTLVREEPVDPTPPTAEEIPRLLESRERKDVYRALREIGRSRLREYLPALTDLVNRPEHREDASRLIDVIAELKDRRWSALQATGAPDTPIDGDLGTAWASKGQDMGVVTLDLEYDRTVRVDGVRVHETLNPGAVARIQARASNGAWETIWEGVAREGSAPLWFEPVVRPTTFATNGIRLVVDTDRVLGWNEIDAVELVGDGLRQWASKATASSSYSDP